MASLARRVRRLPTWASGSRLIRREFAQNDDTGLDELLAADEVEAEQYGPGGRQSVTGITAAIFGGTGFLGRYLQAELGNSGYSVYCANRGDPDDVRVHKVGFDLGHWTYVNYSLRDTDTIKRTLEGCDIVINAVGKHYDTKHVVPHRGADGKLTLTNYSMEEVHIEAPAKIAEIAKSMGITKFLHVSALGADPNSNIRWLSTKGKGEEALKSVFPRATIVRPARLFGPEDRLLNWFANTANSFRVVPLFNGGNALLQPTYVCDVAAAIIEIIEDEERPGGIYELAGDANFTWRELADFTFDVTFQSPAFVNVSRGIGEVLANLSSSLPSPVLVPDDVKLMATDIVLDPKSPHRKYADLDIKPTPIEKVAFNYLHRYRSAGHFPYVSGYH